MLGGLGLPVLDLFPGGGQLGGEVLEVAGGPDQLLFGDLCPSALLPDLVLLSGQLRGQLGPCGRQIGGILAEGSHLLAEFVDLRSGGGLQAFTGAIHFVGGLGGRRVRVRLSEHGSSDLLGYLRLIRCPTEDF